MSTIARLKNFLQLRHFPLPVTARGKTPAAAAKRFAGLTGLSQPVGGWFYTPFQVGEDVEKPRTVAQGCAQLWDHLLRLGVASIDLDGTLPGKRAQSARSDILVAPSEVGLHMRLTCIQAGGQEYELLPPVSYVLRREGAHVFAEAEEFRIHVFAETEKEAQEELRCHMTALIEGYAFDDDANLAKSGQKLKQRLLARLKRV